MNVIIVKNLIFFMNMKIVNILMFSLLVLFSLPACDSGGKGHWDDAGENWKRK